MERIPNSLKISVFKPYLNIINTVEAVVTVVKVASAYAFEYVYCRCFQEGVDDEGRD